MARAIPEDRFEELVQAATAVFLAQGYRRTQVADVAARMGLSKGSLYTYVESKEALFDCVLRHADRREPVALPDTLPVPTPPQDSALELVHRRIASEGALPVLDAALARARVTDVAAELHAVLAELYDALAKHRVSIKLLDRCASDYPELAKLWFRESRERALARLGGYLEDRARRGRLRRLGDPATTARIVLETLAFWAVHRHWDPSPQAFDEAAARQTVLAFLTSALVKETA
ncbi:MAG TPA: helix-turn-helix domain-containing protein [Myxococcota bacterium]|nr:helix-turn-helix domain-containing protein [Myxococcota bacterium]